MVEQNRSSGVKLRTIIQDRILRHLSNCLVSVENEEEDASEEDMISF
jgi:hypothetical protein